MFKRFAKNIRGNVAVISALTLPLVISGAGLGVEVGFWRFDQVRLQQATDAAAYAAAVASHEGVGVPLDAATATATTNGYTSTTDTISLNTPSTATPSDANSVEVVIQRTEPQYFVGLFTSNATKIKASSTATYTTSSDACILALDHSASKAADFAGNSTLTLSGCTVMSNSIAGNSVNVQGSATLSTPCMYAVGGASLGGTLNLTGCPAVQTSQPPVADPYASLAIPQPSGGCQNQGNGKTLNQGYYCSISLNNVNSLNPGTYFVGSGGLSGNANTSVTGSGVTFIMVNGGGVSFNGNAHLNLTPPTSGVTGGFLFISNRGNTASISINGDSTSSMTGTIYAPSAPVYYIGNFSGAGGCTQIVADTVSWSGNTTFSDSCSSYDMSHIQVGSVRLSA